MADGLVEKFYAKKENSDPVKPPCKKFKLDDYDEVSKHWSAELPDYSRIAKFNSYSASNSRSVEYCADLRLAKRLQSKNLFLPSFVNGSPPSPIHATGGPRPVIGRTKKSSQGNATERPKRVPASEFLISTVTQAMRDGNTDFVLGPLHPKQRYQEVLKLPRKSGYSNEFTFEDYMAAQPLYFLPPLPY